MDRFDLAVKRRFRHVELEQFEMHGYQSDLAVPFLRQNPFSALFVDMGLGKTVSSLTVIAELVCDLICESDGKVLIVAPLRVAVDTWPTEIATWRHTAWMNHVVIRDDGKITKEELARSSATVHIINREQLEWLVYFWKDKWPYRTVFLDECFVSGTLVETSTGERPIQTICVGDLVKTPYGNLPVERVIRKSTTSITIVRLEDGREIRCTATHRFFTDIGWVEAQNLNQRRVYGQSDIEAQELQALRRSVLDLEVAPSVLQSFVRQTRPMGQRSNGSHARFFGENQPIKTRSHSLEQGHPMAGRDSEEDGCAKPRTLHVHSRRQRSGDEQGRAGLDTNLIARLGLQLRRCVGCALGWLSDALQNRLRMAPFDAGYRSGRRKSCIHSPSESRSEEDVETFGTRVDSVSSEQCASEVDVYDLTVKGAPFYFAGRTLVHNCSSFKDHNSLRFKALAKVRRTPGLITRLHGLTATPAAESYIHLFAQIYLLDLGERLGKNITAYREEYFNYNRYSMKYSLRLGAEEKILAKIADLCLVMKANDYLPRKAPTVIRHRVQLDQRQLDLIKSLEKNFLMTLADGTEIEAKTAAMMSSMLLQMASGSVYETLLVEDWETDDLKKVKKVHHLHDHKIDALKEMFEEAKMSGEPLMVAYHFQSSLAKLRKAFPKAVAMDKAGKCIKAWNAGKIPMLLIHPQSGGHGLNLQRGPGRTLIFFDLIYSLEYYLQLIGRLDRQGQMGAVIVKLLIAEGTRDELVAECLIKKEDAQETLFKILKRLIAEFRRMRASNLLAC